MHMVVFIVLRLVTRNPDIALFGISFFQVSLKLRRGKSN